MLLADMARPHVALLGRIPGTRRYSDLERHPNNERVPGLLILRVEAPLLYFNANHVRDEARRRLVAAGEPVRAAIIDLSTSPTMDVTAGLMLSGLHRELAAQGIQLRFANAHASVRDLVRAGDGEAVLGELDRKLSLDGVIQEVLAEVGAPGGVRSGP
jgi:MFS superfamily sulfate permease-like transporter